jgi:hypothetical protein
LSCRAASRSRQLVDRCYPEYFVLFGDKSWYRQNVRRAALELAVPCGRSHKRGRPILWAPRDLSVRRRSTAYSIRCECQQRCTDGYRRQADRRCEAAYLEGRGCEVDCLRHVAPAQPSHGKFTLVQQTNSLSPRRLAVSLQTLSEFQGCRRSGSRCDMRLARIPSFRSAPGAVQRS